MEGTRRTSGVASGGGPNLSGRKRLLAGLFAGLLAAGTLLAAGAGAASRLRVVVRVGDLARAEYSPGSRGPAPAAWGIVERGAALIDLERPGDAAALDLAALERLFFPEGKVAAVDLSTGDLAARFAGAGGDRKPQALRKLEALFGAPPVADPVEADAVAFLCRALESAGTAPAASRSAAADGAAALARLQKARVGLIRIVAAGASAKDVALRDAVLRRVVESVGPKGHVVVVNFPRSGAGTAFLAGPRIVRGRVLGKRRSLAFVAAVLARLAAGGGSNLTEGAGARDAHELFR